MYILLILVGLIAGSFIFTVIFGAPYVPSLSKQIDSVFTKLYKIKPNDVLVDLGSGDGIVIRKAAKYGVKKAIGFEINPWLVLISYFANRRYANIETKLANFWTAEIPQDVTVFYIFAESRDINKMVARLQKFVTQSKKKVSVISNGFEIKNAHHIKSAGAHHLYELHPE